MNWYKNLKIRVKLIIGFIIIALFSGIVGTIGIVNLGTANERTKIMYHNNFIPSQELANVEKNIQLVRVNYYLMLFEGNNVKFEERLNEINELVFRTNKTLEHYGKMIRSEEEHNLYNAIKEKLVPYRNKRTEAIDLIQAGKSDEAKAITPQFAKARAELDEAIGKLIKFSEDTAKADIVKSAEDFRHEITIMIIIIISVIVLAIILGMFISNLISKPIGSLTEAAFSISKGDTNIDLNIHTKDEIGMLADAFNNMRENICEQARIVEKMASGDLTAEVHINSDKDILNIKLGQFLERTNEVMLNINTASEQVAAGSKQVSDSSIALSQGATEQASSVEELSASMEEISSQTKQNAINANQANELAEAAKINAEQGNSQMKEMQKAMAEINDSSGNISKIIKVIDEIAFQTNILALNAAVEAARAGQYGKGFAVVAEEVRNLAARSANAAKETTSMIEGSINKVEYGTRIANQTADALGKIVGDVTKVTNLVNEIATASNQQATGVAQVNQGIMQVSQVVQTNSATSEQSASASEELASQATLLKEQVARFKLKNLNRSGNFEDRSSEDSCMSGNQNGRKNITATYGDKRMTGTKNIILTESEFGKY